MSLYCQKSAKANETSAFLKFLCAFLSFSFHHSFSLLTVNSKPRPVLNSIMRPVMSSKCTLLHPLFVMVRGEVFAGSFI